MGEIFLLLGFIFSAYAIVANDSIQTLGTFLASNRHRPWWLLWIWISGIMVVTVTWGWVANGGDPAFGRLSAEGKAIPYPADIGIVASWLFIVPPLALVFLTRRGIPVSTSLLVLTAFKALVAQQQTQDPVQAVSLFGTMMEKSLVGYAIAFVVGLVVCLAVTGAFERKIHAEGPKNGERHPVWMFFQWGSTGFLWSMWLVQDLANIFVFLPRSLALWGLALSLGGMVLLQGYLIRERGGRIQKVVTSKVNTGDVRSATFIDLFYGLILLFFKVDYIPKLFTAMGMEVPWPEKMPMSTTWVFLGLLAGREIGLGIRIRHKDGGKISNLIFADAGKAFAGSVVAVVLALGLPLLASKPKPPEEPVPVEAASGVGEAVSESSP